MQDGVLKNKIHKFIKDIYLNTQQFPSHEQYGLTSQIRRAAVSVMLNYLEGFARLQTKVLLNFLKISFGSVKEVKYILYLAKELNYLSSSKYSDLIKQAEEISAMLWCSIKTLEEKNN